MQQQRQRQLRLPRCTTFQSVNNDKDQHLHCGTALDFDSLNTGHQPTEYQHTECHSSKPQHTDHRPRPTRAHFQLATPTPTLISAPYEAPTAHIEHFTRTCASSSTRNALCSPYHETIKRRLASPAGHRAPLSPHKRHRPQPNSTHSVRLLSHSSLQAFVVDLSLNSLGLNHW